jgi:hypothetical protein
MRKKYIDEKKKQQSDNEESTRIQSLKKKPKIKN